MVSHHERETYGTIPGPCTMFVFTININLKSSHLQSHFKKDILKQHNFY